MSAPLEAALQALQQQAWASAIEHARRALKAAPRSVAPLLVLAEAQLGQGDAPAALQTAQKATKAAPTRPEPLIIVSRCHDLAGRLDQAVKALERAIQTDPAHRPAWQALKSLRVSQARDESLVEDGLARVQKQLEAKTKAHPEDAALRQLYLNVLDWVEARETAIDFYRWCLEQEPDNVAYLSNLAGKLRFTQQPEAARELYRKALEKRPQNAQIWFNLAELEKSLRREDEAIQAYREALDLKQDWPMAWWGLASSYASQHRIEEAFTALEKGLELAPDNPHGLNFKGILTSQIGDSPASNAAYAACQRAAPLNPSYHSNYLLSCNYDETRSLQELADLHGQFGKNHRETKSRKALTRDLNPARRLRVGLVSPDFCWHSVAFFLEPILQHLPANAIELVAYNLNGNPDEMTASLRRHCHIWHDVAGLPTEDLCALIREDQLDIAVDLAGHTGKNALEVFAWRVAPVQVSWLGYPHSTGLQTMDYRLVDARTEPPTTFQPYSSEKLFTLPEGFHAHRLPGELPEVGELPALKNGYITFGSFNNAAKLNPTVIEAWSRLMQAVPASRLILKNKGYALPRLQKKLLRAFGEHGITPERITFLTHTRTTDEHLSQYQKIDIALDPFPYNGTTTTLEALTMGVPLLALEGDRHAARVSASIMHQTMLPEWVAPDMEAYLAQGQALAHDYEKLNHLRQHLRDRLAHSALHDYPLFAQKLTWAFRSMWIDWLETQKVAVAPQRAQLKRMEDTFHALAHQRLSWAAKEAGDPRQALEEAATACAQAPHNQSLWQWRLALAEEWHDRDTLTCCYDAMTALPHPDVLTWANAGSHSLASGQLDVAINRFEQALKQEANRPGIWLNLSVAYERARRYADAKQAIAQALQLQPDLAPAHNNRARLAKATGDLEQSLADFTQAVQREPDNPTYRSNLVYLLHGLPGLSAKEIAQHHRTLFGQNHPTPTLTQSTPRDKIHLGYVTPDVADHSVVDFLLPVLQHHDSTTFDVTLYSLREADSVFQTIPHIRFVSLAGEDAASASARIREDQLDILIDLAGHTSGSLPALFQYRNAPVQLAWLGYPGHPGMGAIDAVIGDQHLATATSEETLVLPAGYHCYAPTDLPKDWPRQAKREASTAVTFGGCHDLAKVNDFTLDIWAKVLQAIPASRFRLRAKALSDPEIAATTRERFLRRGVESARLDLIGWEGSRTARWAFYPTIDIMLDAFPYNGTTTTCEALASGIPVVTCQGDTPASIVGGSLLHQSGHPEWIAATPADIVTICKKLAHSPETLAALKQELPTSWRASTLGHAHAFTRQFEAILRARIVPEEKGLLDRLQIAV